jgi:hypothetical protein
VTGSDLRERVLSHLRGGFTDHVFEWVETTEEGGMIRHRLSVNGRVVGFRWDAASVERIRDEFGLDGEAVDILVQEIDRLIGAP